MKKILFSIMAFGLIICGCTALGSRLTEGFSEQSVSDEVYEGIGKGYRGIVTVQVRMDGANILEIIIIDSEEDRLVGDAAMEELIDLVIMYNSTDIDAVSGATESSKGFLEAVENAIMKR